MGAHLHRPNTRTSRWSAGIIASVITVVAGVAITFGSDGVAGAAVVPTVGLGTSAAYGALGGSTVTNTGSSVINGLNVGVSPGTAVTGFPPGVITPPGTIHRADAQASNAQAAALTAYNDAAGRPAAQADQGLTDLVGKKLQPGVYKGNLSLTGTVTLDNSTNPNAVFIFQASSTLITSSGSVVKFTTTHPSCNVFWQVGSSATLGTGSTFVGTVLAQTSITAQHGATVTGRLLAASGAVTLDTNVITAPSCAPTPTTSSTPPTGPTSGTSTPSIIPPTGPTSSTGRGTGMGTSTSHPVTSTSPPNENTTPSTISRLTTSHPVTSTTTSPPNENTTPSTISLLTTTSGPSANTTTPTSPVTQVTTVVSTTALTQPSFPTGVPGGRGPAAPISPVTVIGALLMGLGCLLLLWRIPATRRLMNRAGTIVTGSRNRGGEHR